MKYQAKLTNTGGRDGVTKTLDGKTTFNIVPPQDGAQKDGTFNPELLVAAAAVSCYNGALLHHLKEAGKSTDGVSVEIEIELVEDERDKENMLSMTLKPKAPHLSQEELKHFSAEADRTCPYTKLFRGEAAYRIVHE